jgi:uncharacterized membrane protein (UPF0127 family)
VPDAASHSRVPLLFDRCVVQNKTRGVELSSKAEVARTFRKRTKGLIGRSLEDFAQGGALWIVPCDGVHTFGMRFPIDVAYLDSKGQIVKIYHRLAPFRIAALSFRTKSVIELPPGILAQTGTDIGDVLEFRAITHPPR